MTGKRLPFTKAARRRVTQNGLGYRPVNNWGGGDLPAPFAEGDVLYLEEVRDDQQERLRGMGRGYFVVSYATSVDEGDAWYFRVWDGDADRNSDRMHVAYEGRVSPDWAKAGPCNYMEGFRLVDTADPDGLALREKLLADGWSFSDEWDVCPTCGHTSEKADA